MTKAEPMTKAELLAALTDMTTQERLEVIEAATQMIRAELAPHTQSDGQSSHSSTMVEVMQVRYQTNSDLNLFTDLNTKNI